MAPSVREIPFTVENARGDAVDCDVRFVADDDGDKDDGDKPVVVFCHGFKGFKDWGPYPEWGRHLARAGFVSVHLNFSHNGVHRDAPTAFTELDRFADNTFTRELDDLRAVLDVVETGRLLEAPADPHRIGLLGHSRGGGTVILQAGRDDRVAALVTWSSVANEGLHRDSQQPHRADHAAQQASLRRRNGAPGRVGCASCRVTYQRAVARGARPRRRGGRR